jgi:signal-transduction protein with cAMP-binding, CBS, and nucleotidyltransferase domain
MIVKNCMLKEPISCHERDSIISVSKVLRDNHLRNIVIVNDSNHPIGIVSSVDIVNDIIAEGLDYKDTKASKVMVSPIVYVDETELISKAYVNMVKHNTYSCPVVNEARGYVGVLSFTEAIKHLSKKVIQKKVI